MSLACCFMLYELFLVDIGLHRADCGKAGTILLTLCCGGWAIDSQAVLTWFYLTLT